MPYTKRMIVSFHPRVHGDVNLRLTPRGLFSDAEAEMISSADAIVVTQGIKAHQYRFCTDRCANIFPDYGRRFDFEGKYGNIQLFRRFNAPHPETRCYESTDHFGFLHFKKIQPVMSFPFVLKGDGGGGGWAIFLVRNLFDLEKDLKILGNERLHPTRRFIAQAFVPHGGRDLRVVVIGGIIRAYWRCQGNPEEFRNNVGRGAVINYDLDPVLMEKGKRCVQEFCSRTGINLAAFDLLFDFSRPEPCPLISEINFLFGRRGLGGSTRYYELLNEAVDEWALEAVGKRPSAALPSSLVTAAYR